MIVSKNDNSRIIFFSSEGDDNPASEINFLLIPQEYGMYNIYVTEEVI